MSSYEKGFKDGIKSANEKLGYEEYFKSLREDIKSRRSGQEILGIMEYYDGYERAINKIEAYILRGEEI